MIEPPLRDVGGESMTHLRIFISSPLVHQQGPADAIQCSRQVFEAVSKAWRLPPHVLPSLLPRTLDTAEVLQFQDPHDAVKPMRFGLAATALVGRSLVTVYDSSKCTTTVFLTLRRVEDLEMIKSLVREYQEAVCAPSGLILLLLEDGVNAGVRARLKYVADQFDEVRQPMNIPPWTSPWQLNPAHDPAPSNAGNINLQECFTTLTGLNQAVAEAHRGITRADRVLQHARHLHSRFGTVSLEPLSGRMLSVWLEIGANMDALEARIRYVQAILEVRRSGTGGLIQTQLTKAQVFAMLAKRGNDVNNDIAQASLQTAKASSEASKDSRKVAILTRQDSTDMRVMAGATLLFLPATFVATLFSSDFFNFQPPEQSIVSHWLWVYCVITLALTGVVMLLWQLQARARDKKTAELLHLKSPELLQAILDEEQSADSVSVGAASGIAVPSVGADASLKKRHT
ncbi:hypothetical protein LTR85_001080 [Meristemomyces frigidus]|nr:hypothetical protein LTR85_001080 [Meristemomyces frigidus]